MDGDAICQALESFSGSDALKDVLPRFGERVKVYNAIKKAFVLSEPKFSQVSQLVSRSQTLPLRRKGLGKRYTTSRSNITRFLVILVL